MFTPGKGGKRSCSILPREKYDWSKSDGAFKEIVATVDENDWAAKCNEIISTLASNQDHDNEKNSPESTASSSGKRKAPGNLIEQISPGGKKPNTEERTDENESNFQKRIKECELGKAKNSIIIVIFESLFIIMPSLDTKMAKSRLRKCR